MRRLHAFGHNTKVAFLILLYACIQLSHARLMNRLSVKGKSVYVLTVDCGGFVVNVLLQARSRYDVVCFYGLNFRQSFMLEQLTFFLLLYVEFAEELFMFF